MTPRRPRLSLGLCALVLIGQAAVLRAQSSPPTWTIREDWRLRTGAVEILQIQGLTVTADGGIIVAAAQDRQVIRFDPGGRHRFTTGREGRGPGEYTAPHLARPTGDSLWVYDIFARRLTVVGPTGRYVRTATLTGDMRLPVDASPRSGRLALGLMPEFVSPQGEVTGWAVVPAANAAAHDERVLVRVGRDSGVTVLTVAPSITATNSYPWQNSVGTRGYATVPFSPRLLHGSSADGRLMVIAWSELQDVNNSVLVVRRVEVVTGAVREHRHTFRPVPVTRARRDSAMRVERAFGPSRLPPADVLARVEARIPVADDLVGRRQLLVAPDGTAYIPLETAEHTAVRYAVFTPAGAHVAWVTIPPKVFLRAATATHLWGVSSDDDGFPHVVRFAVGR